MIREFSGAAPTTALTAGITSTSTSFTVTAGGGAGYPTGATGPFAVALDTGAAGEEKVLCSARSGDTFTVAVGGRGYDGTTASAHGINAKVDHVATATDLREANAHGNDPTRDDHTRYSGFSFGLSTARPAQPYRAGWLYYNTDTDSLFISDGSTWKTVSRYHQQGLLSARPTPTAASGQLFYATDTLQLFRWDGAAWQLIGLVLGPGADQAAPGNHTHPGGTGTTTAAKVAAAEATTSTTYGDLTTVGPSVTVTIGASGTALVVVSLIATQGSTNTNEAAYISFVASGANTIAASDNYAATATPVVGSGTASGSYTYYLTGLTPGSTTFTAKYRTRSGTSQSIQNRVLAVTVL